MLSEKKRTRLVGVRPSPQLSFLQRRSTFFGQENDGNKFLYLVFVRVIFSQHLGLLLEQLGQHLGLLLEQLGQQHLGCFVRTAEQ
jgi:hypothetical protein